MTRDLRILIIQDIGKVGLVQWMVKFQMEPDNVITFLVSSKQICRKNFCYCGFKAYVKDTTLSAGYCGIVCVMLSLEVTMKYDYYPHLQHN